MDPKLLSQLSEVVLQGSLSRAAVTLQVTQPTLTRNMKAIEEAVGAPILRRGRYGVTPTNLGVRLSEQGRIIASAMNMADDTIEHWRIGLVGEVRLGIGPMLSSSLLPGFFAENPMRNANFTLRVRTDVPAVLLQKLRNHEIDMAILPSHARMAMDEAIQEVLFEDEICIMAGSRSPLINLPGKVKAPLLATQAWICINNVARYRLSHDQASKMLEIENVVAKFRFDGDITTPMALLRDSEMLALAPRQFAKKYAALGGIQILETDVELPKRSIVLKVHKGNETDPSVMALSKMIKDYIHKLGLSKEPDTNTVRETDSVD